MVAMDTLAIKTENKFRSLITKQAHTKGEIICEIPTEKVVDKPNRYTVQIGRDRHTQVGKLSALNHSCDPNAGLRERSTLYAVKNIKKGEEITYDYSTTIDESFWCKCSSKNCRGIIYDFFSLPNKAKRYYFGNNALPAHIMKKYRKLLNRIWN